MRKKIIFGILTFLLINPSLAKENKKDIEVWLWVKKNPGKDSRVLEIKEHHACSGKIARLRTKRMPKLEKKVFEGEKVVEISNNKIVGRWSVPIDEILLGVEGSSIFVGNDSVDKILKIRKNGTIISVPATNYKQESKFNASFTQCASSLKAEFGGSEYLRCVIYRDRKSGKKRLFAYEGPCI